MQKLLDGSQEFKDRIEEFIAKVNAQRSQMWLSHEQLSMQNSKTEAEQMAEMEANLDLQMAKVRQIENADYSLPSEVAQEIETAGSEMSKIFSALDQ